MIIPVEEPYFVNYQISLMSGTHDSAANSLIKELETKQLMGSICQNGMPKSEDKG